MPFFDLPLPFLISIDIGRPLVYNQCMKGMNNMQLEFDNISKSFGEKKVLQSVSFSAQSGKAFGLLGRNGAGKTTSIRILMGVFNADNGQIKIDGKPIDRKSIQFGYLPEERGLYPKKKIIDQLIFFTELKGLSHLNAVKSVDYWLDRLGMAEYRSKRLDTLSKGNQQKIQLITALAHNPDIIILDEPFSGLDPVNAMLLKDVVKEEIAKDKTVIFSSHQMSQIEEFCDSIAILNNGKIVLEGDLYEIKRNYPRNKLVVHSQRIAEIQKKYQGQCTRVSENELMITLDSPDDKNAVMKDITESFDIDGIEVFEPSLNDIFVQYAQDIG